MDQTSLVHFVGFRTTDQLWLAVQVFGFPNMIHYHHDRRFVADFAPGDIAVFANGCEESLSEHAVEPDF